MKRFWLVLLALGMLFAFSSSVFAADVKFTGSFYAAGMYQDKTSSDERRSRPTTAPLSIIRDCAWGCTLSSLRLFLWSPVLTRWKECGAHPDQ